MSPSLKNARTVEDLARIADARRRRRGTNATAGKASARRRKAGDPIRSVYCAPPGRVIMRNVVAVAADGSEALTLDAPVPSAWLRPDPWSEPGSGPKMRRVVFAEEVFPSFATAEWFARDLAGKEARRARRVGAVAPPAPVSAEEASLVPPPAGKGRARPRARA